MGFYEEKLKGKRLVGVQDYMKYLGVGRNSALKFGEEIGAKVRIGGRTLYDLKKTDAYLDAEIGITEAPDRKRAPFQS